MAHADLTAKLMRGGIAFGDLNEISDLSRHPHLRRGAVETPGGQVELPAPPAIKRDQTAVLAPVPALGEHTERIKREFPPATSPGAR
jgi:crotonobetainyl-CoA:carnitine CoA-transferase CaiB-like acyl-CoA transferase